MAKEIERKFLTKGNFKTLATHHYQITQGYLSSVPERIVRVRTIDNKGYLTIKGKGCLSRYEWEKEIAYDDAKQMLLICEPSIIEKTRYYIPAGNHIYEVDVFYGLNEGLIVAEIELKSENENFEKPDWLGDEVTYDSKYQNASLIKNPYCNWNK